MSCLQQLYCSDSFEFRGDALRNRTPKKEQVANVTASSALRRGLAV